MPAESPTGCGNSNLCPFEVFKERIAAPHLKHDYKCSPGSSRRRMMIHSRRKLTYSLFRAEEKI